MVVCKKCEASFQNKSNLNRHIKNKHPNLDETEESEHESEMSDDESDIGKDVDVWTYIREEARQNDNGNVLESFKRLVLFYRSLENDETYQAVNETLGKAREEEQMDFLEALDYAVDKRKFLILRSAKESEQEDEEQE